MAGSQGGNSYRQVIFPLHLNIFQFGGYKDAHGMMMANFKTTAYIEADILQHLLFERQHC